jgi:hypothetical protein
LNPWFIFLLQQLHSKCTTLDRSSLQVIPLAYLNEEALLKASPECDTGKKNNHQSEWHQYRNLSLLHLLHSINVLCTLAKLIIIDFFHHI